MRLIYLLLLNLILVSCNLMRAITGGETDVSDNFFSNHNSLGGISTSDFTYKNVVQDVEAIITLDYGGDTEPTNCHVLNLNNVIETKACNCSLGNCTVGLTGLSGYYGIASADFYLSNDDERSNTSKIDISIDFVCPSQYVRVAANNDVGVSNDFCVMKYEAKNVGAVATSQENLAPWVSISAGDSKAECQSLGVNYDLISNPEWMAVAREIENNINNWSGGSIGSGCISRGNHNTGSCGYSNGSAVDFGSSRNILASLELASGEQIWDLAGNVSEWVDWTPGGVYDGNPYTTGVGCTSGEFNSVSCNGMPQNEFAPENIIYGSAEGMGSLYGGSQNGVDRGGAYNGTTMSSGIYLITSNSSVGSTAVNRGFRCVFRP